MKPDITTFKQLPQFDSLARAPNNIDSNSSDLDLMIIDIAARQRKVNSSDKTYGDERLRDDMDLYLAKELLDMNRNPLMMKSLFLPDEEDVYFNNLDRPGVESDSFITDADILKKQALPNKFRGTH
jgi:hypothetical protein